MTMEGDDLERRARALGARRDASSSDELIQLLASRPAPAPDASAGRQSFVGTPDGRLTRVGSAPRALAPEDAAQLFQQLRHVLADQGIRTEGTWGTYVMLAVAGGESIGWAHTIDLHSWAMLGPERIADPGTGRVVDAQWDSAAFRWLHSTIYSEEAPSDWSAEAGRRHDLRHRLADSSLVIAVEATCERRPPEEMVDRMSRGARGASLSRAEVEAFWSHTASVTSANREGWLERLSGMRGSDQSLTEERVSSATLAGRLVGWALSRGITVDHAFLRYADGYATAVRGPLPAGGEKDANQIHEQAMSWLVESLGPVPLRTDLALLAWLLELMGGRVSLARHLEFRASLARRDLRA